MKFVFLIDPLETLNLKKDTSYLLMQGAEARKHEVYILYKDNITMEDQDIFFHVFRLKFLNQNTGSYFIKGEKEKIPYQKINALIIRIDPPCDEKYIQLTWLLEFVKKKVFVLNDPEGIRNVNEKICVQNFYNLTPPTLITANLQDYDHFLQKHKKVVVKPTNSFGGKNIFMTDINDLNSRVIFESVLAISGYAIVQKYVFEAKFGDKRVLLLNGELLGCITRMHGAKDHRNNFATGGVSKIADFTRRDQEIIDVIKPFLQKNKLYFVGVDILGQYLTEINVTSPTCLKEVNKIFGVQLEERVIQFVEEKVLSLEKRVKSDFAFASF